MSESSLQKIHELNNPIQANAEWFVATGQMPETPTPDAVQVGFYTGMQCEELAEKLAAIFGNSFTIVPLLEQLGNALKGNLFNAEFTQALKNPDAVEELLDGDMDLIFVSVGAAVAQGANASEAFGEVIGANWAKKFPDGTFHRNELTGKVLKPEGWKAPNLKPFMHPSLQTVTNPNTNNEKFALC